MKITPFDRYAGLAAMAAGFVGLLYSISFVVLQNGLLSALCLLLGGLLSLAALVGLFQHLGKVDGQSATLGLMLAAVSALGAAIHGGYDLANAIHAPGELTGAVANLPNPVDPRGLLTFGLAGLAVLLAGLLMRGSPRFGRGFTALTFTLGALLIIVYLRYTEFDSTRKVSYTPGTREREVNSWMNQIVCSSFQITWSGAPPVAARRYSMSAMSASSQL